MAASCLIDELQAALPEAASTHLAHELLSFGPECCANTGIDAAMFFAGSFCGISLRRVLRWKRPRMEESRSLGRITAEILVVHAFRWLFA